MAGDLDLHSARHTARRQVIGSIFGSLGRWIFNGSIFGLGPRIDHDPPSHDVGFVCPSGIHHAGDWCLRSINLMCFPPKAVTAGPDGRFLWNFQSHKHRALRLPRSFPLPTEISHQLSFFPIMLLYPPSNKHESGT